MSRASSLSSICLRADIMHPGCFLAGLQATSLALGREQLPVLSARIHLSGPYCGRSAGNPSVFPRKHNSGPPWAVLQVDPYVSYRHLHIWPGSGCPLAGPGEQRALTRSRYQLFVRSTIVQKVRLRVSLQHAGQLSTILGHANL